MPILFQKGCLRLLPSINTYKSAEVSSSFPRFDLGVYFSQKGYFPLRIVISQESLQHSDICPVGWGCRIRRLRLCKGIRPTNEYPGYDTKQSDGEAPVMLEPWGMRSTPSLQSLPGPLCPGVVAPDRAMYMGQKELNCILIEIKLFWFLTVYLC